MKSTFSCPWPLQAHLVSCNLPFFTLFGPTAWLWHARCLQDQLSWCSSIQASGSVCFPGLLPVMELPQQCFYLSISSAVSRIFWLLTPHQLRSRAEQAETLHDPCVTWDVPPEAAIRIAQKGNPPTPKHNFMNSSFKRLGFPSKFCFLSLQGARF